MNKQAEGRKSTVALSRQDGPQVVCVTRSDRGLVRTENEDNIFVNKAKTVFCVADGMGGGSEGALASKIVCDEVAKVGNGGLVERMATMDAAVMAANERIFRYAKEKGYQQMGSTVAALLFAPDEPLAAAVCHVGDSRVYRVRKGKSELLTEDHTVGRQLGVLTKGAEARGFMSRANPLAHVLTRGIGVDPKVSCDWRRIDIEKGDRFLICSDGVHDVITDVQVGKFLGAEDVERVPERLSARIVKCGAPDHYSFVVVEFKSV